MSDTESDFFTEDDLLPISALSHLSFCERRWGLIYLENVWAENRFTAEGKQLHDRVHESNTEVRGDLRITRSLRLRSLRYGLTGIADVVEFHRLEKETSDEEAKRIGIQLQHATGYWRPFPVEYKRGKPKIDDCYHIQLCGQALCLEEMLGIEIAAGALFFGEPRRREDVFFDLLLRNETIALAKRLHELSSFDTTPSAAYEKKCHSCSIMPFCLPRVAGSKSAQKYLTHVLDEIDDTKGIDTDETSS